MITRTPVLFNFSQGLFIIYRQGWPIAARGWFKWGPVMGLGQQLYFILHLLDITENHFQCLDRSNLTAKTAIFFWVARRVASIRESNFELPITNRHQESCRHLFTSMENYFDFFFLIRFDQIKPFPLKTCETKRFLRFSPKNWPIPVPYYPNFKPQSKMSAHTHTSSIAFNSAGNTASKTNEQQRENYFSQLRLKISS